MNTDYLQSLRALGDRFEHCLSLAAVHLPDQPLIYVNRAFERDTGYTVDECLGRNCRFLQGSLSQQPGRAMMAADIAAERASFTDVINFRRDGRAFVNRLLLLPFAYLAAPDERYYIGIQRVLSEVSDLSDSLERLRHGEIESEINNPLSVALGFAELGEADSARVDAAIARIEDYVDALAGTG
jgi:PAS domain S-box-containing protein